MKRQAHVVVVEVTQDVSSRSQRLVVLPITVKPLDPDTLTDHWMT
jgi:hypothetical protein